MQECKSRREYCKSYNAPRHKTGLLQASCTGSREQQAHFDRHTCKRGRQREALHVRRRFPHRIGGRAGVLVGGILNPSGLVGGCCRVSLGTHSTRNRDMMFSPRNCSQRCQRTSTTINIAASRWSQRADTYWMATASGCVPWLCWSLEDSYAGKVMNILKPKWMTVAQVHKGMSLNRMGNTSPR